MHLGDLVGQFAKGIVQEIDEHEVDDRSRAGHRRATAEADESALANRGVAEPFGSILGEQSGGRREVSSAGPDAFTENKDARIAPHLMVEGFDRRGNEGEFPLPSGRAEC